MSKNYFVVFDCYLTSLYYVGHVCVYWPADETLDVNTTHVGT
jgi:hypothetical protein